MTEFWEKSGALKKKDIKKLLKQSMRTSKTHQRITGDNYSAVVDKEFCQPAEFCEFVEKIDDIILAGESMKVNSKSTYVCRLNWNAKDIIVKKYNYKGVIHSFRHTIKKSRARHSWLYSHRLKMLNIPTSNPLAYIEMYWGPFLKKSYFISEYFQVQNLYDFLQDDITSREQLLAVAQKVWDLLEHMGKRKIFHGDLKFQNILLEKDKAIIIDLDRMKAHRWNWIYRFWRAKDLARFAKYLHDYPAFEALLHNLLYEKG